MGLATVQPILRATRPARHRYQQMKAGPIKRFERWRTRQAARTADLAQRVLDELVPLYEASGFGRFDHYADGDLSVVRANTIGLQRRSGDVQFDRRGRASFNITFAELPQACTRWTSGSRVSIERKQANVVEGGEYFALCKGFKRNFDCTFGAALFATFIDRLVARDFELAKDRSKSLIQLFDSGLPESWAEASPGYVSEFVFKMSTLRAPE